MKRKMPWILVLGVGLADMACDHYPLPGASTSHDIQASKATAEENTTRYDGRFSSLTRLDYRNYSLVLVDSAGKKDTFRTLMPLDETEISLLRKSGNNITVHYRSIYNPVQKKTEKVVQSMVPVYDLGAH